MPAMKTILVTGATGKQGGAVARSLLERGYLVRAFVRDPGRLASRELAALGAELAVGDFDDAASLCAAVQDVHGVFSAQPGDLPDPDPAVNARRGRAIVDAAAAAGAAHLVYSTAAAVGRGSGVGHVEAMAEVEAYLAAADIPATVLRPVFLMENWTYLIPEMSDGERVASLAMDADTRLQMVSVRDIGRIAAEAFEDPDVFVGTTLEVAADELTVRRVAEVFSSAGGVPTRFERQPIEVLRKHSEQVADFFAWLNGTGYDVDISALRDRWPELLTLEAWLA